ncbi:hypothetical protein ABT297_04005 [Dactylosporangium sp. NPDC000555]|uniref:hypothetical protein n=1 Tax=Dactylosporangium sp. NPDC000555 TaxID=3154260 RepID=UPI003321984F
MRVPADPHNPTYDHVIEVTFGQWLRSSGADRREWARRRNAALKAQHQKGVQARRQRAAHRRQQVGNAMPASRPRVRPAPQDPQAAAWNQQAQRLDRWLRLEQWLLGIELVIVLIPIVVCLVGTLGVAAWWIVYR